MQDHAQLELIGSLKDQLLDAKRQVDNSDQEIQQYQKDLKVTREKSNKKYKKY